MQLSGTLFGVVFTFWCFVSNGQNGTFDLRGTIINPEGEKLEGAFVRNPDSKKTQITDKNGNFHFTEVNEGVNHLHVTHSDYQDKLLHLDLTSDTVLEIVLDYKVHELDEVIITSDPLKQTRLQSSVLSESISQQYIDRNAGTTLMNTLEKRPGISSINMGVGISKPVIRGLSFNRVVVADNGIKQEGQQWGADHGLEIDQYDVENLEIIRGPASLVYGSDALGGVINIKHDKLLPENTHTGQVRTLYRSFNDTYGLSAMAKGNINNWGYRINLTGLDYGDYRVPAKEFTYNRFVLPVYNERLKNTAGRERHFSLKVARKHKKSVSSVTFSGFNQVAGIFSGAMGIPTAYQLVHDGDFRNIELPKQDVRHYKIISNHILSFQNFKWETDLGFQHNNRKEHSFPHAHGQDTTDGSDLALHLILNTFTLNTRLVKEGEKLSSVYGLQASFQDNRTGGFEFLIPDYYAFQKGLYTVQKYKFSPRLYVNGGIRFEYGHISAEETWFPFYFMGERIDTTLRSPLLKRDFFNYSAALGASYILTEDLNLKLNFGKTFRLPAAPELTANGMHHGTFRYERGRPDLNPEQGYQFDLVLAYNAPRLKLTFSPYYNYFTNYIYLSPSGVFPTINIDGTLYPIPEAGQEYSFRQTPALHRGAEAELVWRINKKWNYNLTGDLVYADNLITGLPLPFTPPPSVKNEIVFELAKLKGNWRNFFVSGEYQLYAPQKRVERNELETPGFQLFNIASGVSFNIKDVSASLYFQVHNLTDEKYFNHLSRYRLLNLPEPGRTFNVTLKVQL
ncbi:TonB-dependent receptor [Cytophagaceae bacterium ABcell3]|nr:TonB-dependent receptor [Cytophagaceae bacterium ABcell3]